MTSIDFEQPVFRNRAVTRVLDLENPYAIEPGEAGPMRVRRLGTFAFWAAVALLLVARVILFDPSATRETGSFPDKIAPALYQR